ncbi:hypothetical protein J1N35_043956 [Gossypium stocksii]|uniref:Uncharacterized protein n=1 Tax=Gossypium stocksii TaxID=47602 RepID=A0A9D3U8C7_9ROSI|nr:hypothetical protein J1N35_043956 [Gossypium stocksii]
MARESSWKEKFKYQDQRHLSKLEHLRQSNKEDLKKTKRTLKKNLAEVLPILQSNLVLHAQVAMSPLNLSQMHFKC